MPRSEADNLPRTLLMIPNRNDAHTTTSRRHAHRVARIIASALLVAAMLPAAAEAQRTGRRPTAGGAARPYGRNSAAGSRPRSRVNRRGRTPDLNRNGTSNSQINVFLNRPRGLVQRSAFGAPVRRMSLGSTSETRKYTPTQDEIDRAVEEITRSGALERPDRYAEFLFSEITAQRRRLLTDAWGYFKDRDYLRSRAAFEAAEMIDTRAPAPRFGLIMLDVANQHYRRAMTQLAKNVGYDARRAPGAEGLFDYDVSLRLAFASEDDLRSTLLSLREFAQQNLEVAPVQALYCYVLWYSRFQDGMIESASIAARLRRTARDPESPWAKFDGFIQAARRKMQQDRQAQGLPGAAGGL